jgi:hypothetical protein
LLAGPACAVVIVLGGYWLLGREFIGWAIIAMLACGLASIPYLKVGTMQ